MPRPAPDARRLRIVPARARTAIRPFTASLGRSIAASARARRWVALRAAVAIAIPMLIGLATGHLTQGVQAGLGSFAALYGTGEPYRRRAALLAFLVVAVTAAMVLGTLVGGHDVATVIVGGIVGAVAALGARAARIGPPREFFVLLIFLLGAAQPPDPGAWLSRGATVFAGATLAALIALSPWLLRPRGPVPGVVARAKARVADLLDAIGGPDEATTAHDAIVAVRAALEVCSRATDPAARAWSGRAVAVEHVMEAALALRVDDAPPIDRRWGQRLRARSADGPGARKAVPSGGGEPPDDDVPVPAGPGGRLLRESVARASAAWSTTVERDDDLDLAVSWRVPAWWSLSPESEHPRIALRVGLAVSGGLAVGFAFGLSHPQWVAVSAASVLQAATASAVRTRGLQRALGTAAGVVLAGALLALDPSEGAKIGGIVVLQFTAQLLMVGSYGIAVVALNAMVLLMFSMMGVAPVDGLLDARVIDTFVGCAVATALIVVIPPRERGERLAAAQAATLRRSAVVLGQTLAPPATADPERRADRDRLRAAIRRLRAAEEAETGDAFRLDPRDDARWPLTATVDRLARLVLALPARTTPAPGRATGAAAAVATAARPGRDDARDVDDADAAAPIRRRLEAFARRIGGDATPSPLLTDPVPLRSPWPRISEAAEQLRRQLVDRERPA